MHTARFTFTLILCFLVLLYSVPLAESHFPIVITKHYGVGKGIIYKKWPWWGWGHSKKAHVIKKLAKLAKLKLLIKLGKLGIALKIAKKLIWKPKYKYPKWVITKGVGVHKYKWHWG